MKMYIQFLKVLKKLENSSLPPLRIPGDTQYQLSTFIKILGDHRRTRRPRNAVEAYSIFEALVELKNKKIKAAFPEIMIPLVSTEAEIKIMKELSFTK